MAILAKAINRYNTVIIEFPLFFFSEIEKKIFKLIFMHKRNPEEKKQFHKYHHTCFQDKNGENSRIQALKQTHKSTGQNERLNHKPIHL